MIYLPIAEMPVSIWLMVGLGAAVGFLSGMFGVGGGFILTPFLMFMGVPPAVAVATQSVQLVATSTSSVLTHWRNGHVDFKMGGYLLAGGMSGSVLGIFIFNALKAQGQIDLLISLSYVTLLTAIGGLMLWENLSHMFSTKKSSAGRHKAGSHLWIHGLPFKARFPVSRLYISAIPPLLLGFLIGVLSAIMGIGGGFILVPAMIYLLRMPAAIVVGTSLFQVIFVAMFSGILHAVTNQTVDIILASLLTVGGVVGAQIGVRTGARVRADELRLILALMILAVGVRLTLDLVWQPSDPFSVTEEPAR
ncbi:MAG TPA: permease [Alphaproteobacteria bacterium]|nr:permease [Alphaproteobacteria bacterium]HAJ47408.1 permease [Alphaproteobacteria bacterium]